MGNSASSSSSPDKGIGSSGGSPRHKSGGGGGSSSKQRKDDGMTRATRAVGEFSSHLQSGLKKLEENDHPAAQLIDSVCGPYLDQTKYTAGGGRSNNINTNSFYSEDQSEDGSMSRNTISEDETTTTTDYHNYRSRRAARIKDEQSVDTMSYMSQSDYSESQAAEKRKSKRSSSYESEDESRHHNHSVPLPKTSGPPHSGGGGLSKPLASAFAKRCYFTKAGIGKTTQHYEGLTLTGNVVLMLASAMKLKGCPTICDEDLRRVEQTYPNQFSRLPDELLLSSGWRRISKYCHFSNKPIPDGIPFFHSKQRLHPSGGYYFLLAAAVGMVRPIDVEPLTRDTLVLLETDYPTACDQAPDVLIKDPEQWTLVDKFCFFSGGPINTDEDVYYQADFDGNPIFMLAFLSPSLTPAELYKLDAGSGELRSVAAVEEVESVYDLTDRDFDDLKLYHLGPCRALPQYILQPQAWTKVLPPHFLAARMKALQRAREYEHRVEAEKTPTAALVPEQHLATARPLSQLALQPLPTQQIPLGQGASPTFVRRPQDQAGSFAGSDFVPPSFGPDPSDAKQDPSMDEPSVDEDYTEQGTDVVNTEPAPSDFATESESPDGDLTASDFDDTAYHDHGVNVTMDTLPMDEAMAIRAARGPPVQARMDPPEDEPPSLSKRTGHHSESPANTFSHIRDPHDEEGVGVSFEQSFEKDEPTASYNSGDYYESSPEKAAQLEDRFERPRKKAEFLDEESAGDAFSPAKSGEDHEFFAGPSSDSDEKPESSPDYAMSRKKHLPPVSPRSIGGSELSQSSAMRGAQELIRRNRQKRLEMARKRELYEKFAATEDEDFTERPTASPHAESESGAAWETGSEMTSAVSGTSSAWTDGSANPDRSSRRALILQMAKARMKSHKPPEQSTASTISGLPQRMARKLDDGDSDYAEEKKLDVMGADIDLTEDLD